jgi:predicted transposase YbfD/YdcC
MAPLSQLPQQQQLDLSIPKFFAKLQDPRRAHRRLHRLQDIIVIALCAVIAGAQDWQQIETFGRKRRAWLGGFLELLHGIPSHDTFERVFERLKPQAFQACFRQWVQAISAALRIKHIAIDGKTLRGSRKQGAPGVHLLSAVSHRLGLTLGQAGVDDKTNEIPVAPRLLAGLLLEGRVVTMDALLTQRAVACTIVDGGGDYVMIVKENQPQLYSDIATYFAAPPPAPMSRGRSRNPARSATAGGSGGG